MGSIRVLALLIALVLGAGCQTISKAHSDRATSTVESPSPVAIRAEPPDADALSPASPPPPPQEFVAVARLADIHFDYDDHDVRPADTPIADENAAWLKANPNFLLLIDGHADERGTSEYNLTGGPHGGDLVWQGAPRLHRPHRGVLGAEPTGLLPG